MKYMASPSAVAVIEIPNAFLAEGRPDIPGKLAHSGRVQLFGGHIDGQETPEHAICRELQEELGLDLAHEPPLVWNGIVESQTRHGEPALREVNLFYIKLASFGDLAMRVTGDLVTITKTAEGVERYQDKLTQFAYDSLSKVLRGELGDGFVPDLGRS